MRHVFTAVFICGVLFTSSCKKVNDDCNLFEYTQAPGIEWHQSVAGSEEESHGHFIMTCTDGGYLQVGETGIVPKSAKILVVKTDHVGNLLWKKEFGNGGSNMGNAAIETADGYLICGALDENSALLKLDKNDGSEQFSVVIDNGGTDAFEHLVKTPNGIICVGYVHAQDPSNTFYTEGEGFITFLNTEGRKLNGVNINPYLSQAYRIYEFQKWFYISGLTKNADDFGLLKMDSVGTIQWSRNYGGAAQDHCFGMDITNDGSIFLTGHTLSGTENWDTYTTKIDTAGTLIWEARAGNPRGFKPAYIHDEAWGVKSTLDGGCIIVAGTGDEYGRYSRRCGSNGDNSNTWHIYLIKYNASGSLEWQKTYGSEIGIDWAGEAIDLTSDGGAIVALDNGQFGFVKIEDF